MNLEMIVSIVGLLVGLTALVAFFDNKIKDAEKMGALKQRVQQLESDQLKNEATKNDINTILIAIGKITAQIEELQRSVEELKTDVRCVERRKD